MELTNSKAMAMLLEALKLRPYEWTPKADKIILNINQQQLAYAMNASSYAVQDIYGKTEEWLELCKYLRYE